MYVFCLAFSIKGIYFTLTFQICKYKKNMNSEKKINVSNP